MSSPRFALDDQIAAIPATVRAVLASVQAPALDPERPCLVDKARSLTFREVQQRTHRIGNKLRAAGLAYPIRNGVPVMLRDEARDLGAPK